MIFKHKRTGNLYRAVTRGYSVELQKIVICYMSLDTGAMFVRAEDQFMKKFQMMHPAENYVTPKNKEGTDEKSGNDATTPQREDGSGQGNSETGADGVGAGEERSGDTPDRPNQDNAEPGANCPTCGERVNSIFDHVDKDC